MSREFTAGAVLGVTATAVAGLLWYRHWSGVPQVQAALRRAEFPPSIRAHDHWTWASEEEVERAFSLLEERRLAEHRRDDLRMDEALNSPRLRPVDRDQWCGEENAHRAHERCGGVVAIEHDDRPQCRWPEVHGSHVWRDVENEGYRAKPRYCRGRTEGE